MNDAPLALSALKSYPFVLRFTREFTHGTCLAGTTHEDSLGFCSESDARDWVIKINAANVKSRAKNDRRMTYKVIAFHVVSRVAA